MLFNVYPLFEVCPVRGQGCYVFDKNGTAYLDLYGGHAVISVGHSHPHYVSRLREQLAQLGFYSNSVQNPLQEAFAEKLLKATQLTDYQLFMCNSGTEAIENALKLASFQTGNKKVIAFRGCFHGRTSAAVNATDNAAIQAPLNQTFPVEHYRLNHDLNLIEKSLACGDTCAVLIEGIQGIGGIQVPEPAFLKRLEHLCRAFNVPLILDEVQSGYGRTGRFFAFQSADIQPDIIAMAKGMGNGFPVGGILIHPKYKARHGLLGHTFGGNHLACAAGLAVLEIFERENLVQKAAKTGQIFMEALAEIPEVKSVRGRGLMIGVAFDFPVKALRKTLVLEEKVFTGSSNAPEVLRLLPPLNIDEKELFIFIEKLKNALTRLSLTSIKK